MHITGNGSIKSVLGKEFITMKTKNKLSLLAGLAVLLTTGMGYAAWTFNAAVNKTAAGTSKVTAAIEANDVTPEYTQLYLIVDACAETSHKHLPGKGIYWSTSATNDISKKVETIQLTGTVNYEANDIVDFSKYVGHFEISSNATATDYVSFGESADSQDITVNSVDGDCLCTYTLPTVSYIKCPESFAEVTTMKNQLSDITFTVSFNVKNVVAA